MTMKRWLSALAITAGALLPLVPQTAHASFLGSKLLIEWHFPDIGGVIGSTNNVVGPGIEFPEQQGGPNIDVDAATIEFSGANGTAFSSATFNGFIFTDSDSSIAEITGVSILSQTGYVGFDATDLSFTADTISVNFEGAGAINEPLNQVTLLVQFAPEPGSLALIGLAIAGLGFSLRRRVAS